MKNVIRGLASIFLMLVFLPTFAMAQADGEKQSFDVCYSHYTGWEPWAYADDSGILAKWAEKEGIEIELTLVNDYVESINQYTAGHYQACTMTNMDALTIPAVGGVDTESLIIGDTSHGNDAIVIKGGDSVRDLANVDYILIYELTVSHYALVRALDMNGLRERDVKLVNITDAEIASAFANAGDNVAAVTWNPPLMTVRNEPGANMVFDSSEIPGEIIDMMVVQTDAPESLKRALVGAWFETMSVMSSRNRAGEEAIALMADAAGGTVAEFRAQLRTTRMFYAPDVAVNFTEDAGLKQTMEFVRTFSFDHGLYGDGAPSKDLVGIEFHDGSVIGDANNVKLRFTSKWMNLAASGALQ